MPRVTFQFAGRLWRQDIKPNKKNNNVKTKNQILSAALIIAALSFNSCKKEETPTVKNDGTATKKETFTKIAKKEGVAHAAIVNLAVSLPQLVAKTSGYMKTFDEIEGFGCATVTIDSTSSPKTATFDFGTGCTDADGKTYSGVMNLQFDSADLSVAGNTVHVDFVNFVDDSIEFNGTLDFVNNGTNVAGNLIGHITTNLTTTFAHDRLMLNGTTDMSFEYIDARSTLKIDITGNATDGNGIAFTQTSTSTIELKGPDGCKEHFTKGILLLQSPGLDDESIDYGNGTCDDQATSTVGTNAPVTFTLE